MRNEYDRHIKLLQELLQHAVKEKTRFYSFEDIDKDKIREFVSDFKEKIIEVKLKKLQTKRLKLNMEIQKSNLNNSIPYQGDHISLNEALEIRKTLLQEITTISQKVNESIYKRVIYKEKRDIIHKPRFMFKEIYTEFQKTIKNYSLLISLIHHANHSVYVKFKKEKEHIQ